MSKRSMDETVLQDRACPSRPTVDAPRNADDPTRIGGDGSIDGMACLEHSIQEGLSMVPNRLLANPWIRCLEWTSIGILEDDMEPLAARECHMDQLELRMLMQPSNQSGGSSSHPLQTSPAEWAMIEIEHHEMVEEDRCRYRLISKIR